MAGAMERGVHMLRQPTGTDVDGGTVHHLHLHRLPLPPPRCLPRREEIPLRRLGRVQNRSSGDTTHETPSIEFRHILAHLPQNDRDGIHGQRFGEVERAGGAGRGYHANDRGEFARHGGHRAVLHRHEDAEHHVPHQTGS